MRCVRCPFILAPEIMKKGGETVKQWLYETIFQSWATEEVPQSWKDAELLLLWKKKGSKADLDNYRTIALLGVGGKIMAKILQFRISHHIEEAILDKDQFGFRPKRSTLNAISVLRRVQEHVREKGGQLHMLFLDLIKAYDTVHRSTMWRVMERYGLPTKIVNLVKALHEGQSARVSQHNQLSNSFSICTGLRQGCCLSPTLFLMYLQAVIDWMHICKPITKIGVPIRTRRDGDFFSLARFKAKTKSATHIVQKCLYADDCVLLANSCKGLQKLASAFEQACTDFGLTISVNKTKSMVQGATKQLTPIYIYSQPIERVQSFCYLGSHINEMGLCSQAVKDRIQKAQGGFNRLWWKVFKRKDLKKDTKVMIYRACVESILTYGLSVATLYATSLKQLEFVHFRHLRTLLGYNWKDRKSYLDLLSESGLLPISIVLIQLRGREIGKMAKLDPSELPVVTLFGEYSRGKRKQGGQLLNFRTTLRRDLMRLQLRAPDCSAILGDWAAHAAQMDDLTWQDHLRKGIAIVSQAWAKERQAKKERKSHLQAKNT